MPRASADDRASRLAVLAVRGWREVQLRLRVPVAVGGAADAAAMGLGIVSAAVLKLQQVWT